MSDGTQGKSRDWIGPPRNTRNGDPAHWMPENKRRGLPLRPKQGFASEQEALAFAASHADLGEAVAYVCPTCGEWHLASRFHRGRDRRTTPH